MIKQVQPYATVCFRCAVIITLLCTVILLRQSVMKKTPGMIYMLQWTNNSLTKPFSAMGRGDDIYQKRKCPVKNCYVTSDVELLGDVTNFDVILFDAKGIIDSETKIPKSRKYNQNYVLAGKDSAGAYPVNPATYYGFFNSTWTYKLSSDIFFGSFVIKNRNGEIIGPSAGIQWMSNKDMLPVKSFIKKKIANKHKAAVWFTTQYRIKCGRARRKIDYRMIEVIAHIMAEYGITLDMYGFCGIRCPQNNEDNCFKLFEEHYFFYFVFEDSFAEDYVSEKLLHALNHYTIPVVFGGADYKRFLPDGSYLDATALGPAKLVKEMFEIMIDPERYSDFFKWHSHYSYHNIMDSPDTDPYCKLCEYAHRVKEEKISNVIYDLEDWWNPQAEQWSKFYSMFHFSNLTK